MITFSSIILYYQLYAMFLQYVVLCTASYHVYGIVWRNSTYKFSRNELKKFKHWTYKNRIYFSFSFFTVSKAFYLGFVVSCNMKMPPRRYHPNLIYHPSGIIHFLKKARSFSLKQIWHTSLFDIEKLQVTLIHFVWLQMTFHRGRMKTAHTVPKWKLCPGNSGNIHVLCWPFSYFLLLFFLMRNRKGF